MSHFPGKNAYKDQRRRECAAEYEAQLEREREAAAQHDREYWDVVERLQAPEIDPQRLRDYLNGLPGLADCNGGRESYSRMRLAV